MGRSIGLAVLLAALRPSGAPAQAPPGTDVWIAPLARRGGALEVGLARNLTARPGYDNQPGFSPDGGAVYFTSQREGQTDIFRVAAAGGPAERVTNTPESEYSPTVMPGGRELAVVRVEADSTQRLWAFPAGGGAPRLLFPAWKPVGYFAWLDAETAYAFILGSPATLQRARVGGGAPDTVAVDIGRTILRVPGRAAMSFLQRADSVWRVVAVPAAGGPPETLAAALSGSEFFAWTPWGDLLMASGNRVARWVGGAGAWETVATFAEPGLQRITRLAVAPGGEWLALVSGEASP